MKKQDITEVTDEYWNNWSYQESSGNFVIAEDMFDEMVESLVQKSSDIHNVSNSTCKGSFILGTACMKCSRCKKMMSG
jgi:hypothetical protein